MQKQAQPRADVEALGIAPVGEQFALHVLHRQVRQAVGIDAGVVQARDVRMFQARENVALAGEALFQIATHARERGEFQGHVAIEGTVGAFRQPHLGHAAGAKQTDQLVRTHAVAGLKSRRLGAPGFIGLGGFQEGAEVPAVGRLREFRQQRLAQGSIEVLVFRGKRFQPATPPRVIQGQRLVEQAAHHCDLGGAQPHSCP